MIDDVRARVASIQTRFGQRPQATAPPAVNGADAAMMFQQMLATQGMGSPMQAGPTTLGAMWGGAMAPTAVPPWLSGPTATPYWPSAPTPRGSVPERAAQFQPAFEAAGARYGVDPSLLAAVAWTESNFNPDAVSHAGALGLMQIMPGTAQGLGVDPRDPLQAIDGAARYLRKQMDRFGDVRLALAAYNAGPGAVERYGGIPPYAETTAYVGKVLSRVDQLRSSPR